MTAKAAKSIFRVWQNRCHSAVSNCAASEAPARFEIKRTFRQDDPPTELQLQRDKAESERSGERLPLAARRVSAANQFAGGISKGPPTERRASTAWEGQRPRLTHFATTAARNRFQTRLQGI